MRCTVILFIGVLSLSAGCSPAIPPSAMDEISSAAKAVTDNAPVVREVHEWMTKNSKLIVESEVTSRRAEALADTNEQRLNLMDGSMKEIAASQKGFSATMSTILDRLDTRDSWVLSTLAATILTLFAAIGGLVLSLFNLSGRKNKMR